MSESFVFNISFDTRYLTSSIFPDPQAKCNAVSVPSNVFSLISIILREAKYLASSR